MQGFFINLLRDTKLIKLLILFSLGVVVLINTGCEKDISFDLTESPEVLVVDAGIENSLPPTVVLTKSLNYFSNLNVAILNNLFVHNARVTISNGVFTHQLREYEVPTGLGFSYYFYSTDSANLATAFVGAFNTNYELNIESEGKTYQANTTIPILAKKPDSMWWRPAPFAKDSNDVILTIRAKDPPGLGNYVRYFTQKNSERFLPGENSVFDDRVIDGSSYTLDVNPGVDRNLPMDRNQNNSFKRGDTITLKLCNIDRTTFKFWNSWEFAVQSVGNPFSQPGTVLGNISNGALGAFCGYAADYKKIIVPR